MVTLARFGLTTGFLLGPADDRRCRLVFSQKQIFLLGINCANCTNCGVNIQGVLGEGTLGYKVMLIIYRVCLEKAPWFPGLESFWSWCFQADVLLEIPRVHVSG